MMKKKNFLILAVLSLILMNLLFFCPVLHSRAVAKDYCKKCGEQLAKRHETAKRPCGPAVDLMVSLAKELVEFQKEYAARIRLLKETLPKKVMEYARPLEELRSKHKQLIAAAAADGAVLPRNIAARVYKEAKPGELMMFGIPLSAMTDDAALAKKAEHYHRLQNEILLAWEDEAKKFEKKAKEYIEKTNKDAKGRLLKIKSRYRNINAMQRRLSDMFYSGKYEHCLGRPLPGQETYQVVSRGKGPLANAGANLVGKFKKPEGSRLEDLPGMSYRLPPWSIIKGLYKPLPVPKAPSPPKEVQFYRDGLRYAKLYAEVQHEQEAADRRIARFRAFMALTKIAQLPLKKGTEFAVNMIKGTAAFAGAVVKGAVKPLGNLNLLGTSKEFSESVNKVGTDYSHLPFKAGEAFLKGYVDAWDRLLGVTDQMRAAAGLRPRSSSAQFSVNIYDALENNIIKPMVSALSGGKALKLLEGEGGPEYPGSNASFKDYMNYIRAAKQKRKELLSAADSIEAVEKGVNTTLTAGMEKFEAALQIVGTASMVTMGVKFARSPKAFLTGMLKKAKSLGEAARAVPEKLNVKYARTMEVLKEARERLRLASEIRAGAKLGLKVSKKALEAAKKTPETFQKAVEYVKQVKEKKFARTKTLAKEKNFLPHEQKPAAFMKKVYGKRGESYARAYEKALQEIEKKFGKGKVEGIAGSFARGEARLKGWGKLTFDEIQLLDKMPDSFPERILENLPERSRYLFELKKKMGGEKGLPSDLDLSTSVTDEAFLTKLAQKIYKETGVYIEFTKAHGVGKEFLSILKKRAGEGKIEILRKAAARIKTSGAKTLELTKRAKAKAVELTKKGASKAARPVKKIIEGFKAKKAGKKVVEAREKFEAKKKAAELEKKAAQKIVEEQKKAAKRKEPFEQKGTFKLSDGKKLVYGKRLGKGSLQTVYESKNPNEVVKVYHERYGETWVKQMLKKSMDDAKKKGKKVSEAIKEKWKKKYEERAREKNKEEIRNAIQRRVETDMRLKRAGIPFTKTKKIVRTSDGRIVVVEERINTKSTVLELFRKQGNKLTTEQQAAIVELRDKLAKNGMVGTDLSFANLDYIRDSTGRLHARVIDKDAVVNVKSLVAEGKGSIEIKVKGKVNGTERTETEKFDLNKPGDVKRLQDLLFFGKKGWKLDNVDLAKQVMTKLRPRTWKTLPAWGGPGSYRKWGYVSDEIISKGRKDINKILEKGRKEALKKRLSEKERAELEQAKKRGIRSKGRKRAKPKVAAGLTETAGATKKKVVDFAEWTRRHQTKMRLANKAARYGQKQQGGKTKSGYGGYLN